MCEIFQKNGKKGQKIFKKKEKGQNIWKSGHKCAKFENISKRKDYCMWLSHIVNC